MTLREMVDAVLEEVGYSAQGASSDVRVRVRRRINEWHRRLLSQPTLSRLLRDTYTVTFASVANQATYGLPASVGRINSLYDTANDVRLAQRSLDWLRTMDAGLSAAGVPEAYIPLGIAPVQTQPSDASTCYVVSASASDTDAVVRLSYLDAAGVMQSATATLTGTTAVAIGTGVVEITGCSVSPVPVGAVTLTEDSGSGTTLARIPAGASGIRYLRIQLWPTPQGAVTYSIDATRDTTDLVEEHDEPLLPRDFHYLLVKGAVADELLLRDDTRYDAVRLDMEQGKRDLNHWLWNNVDFQPTGARAAQPSRLGAWFPAGS